MYKLIQKNQKKFLAFFGVLLMIVFILPNSVKNNANRGDLAIGTLNGEKIYGRDLAAAKNDLDALRQFPPLFELGGDNRGTVAKKFLHDDDGALAYLLLQKEAQKAGISVSEQDVDALIKESFQTNPLSANQQEQITPAVSRFMLVQAGFERASDTVKVSRPLLEYTLSQVFQGATLNLVDFRADEMEKSAPDPTPEQVRQEYERYADTFSQPLFPGYKVPDRVKLQFLEIPKAAVVQSVLNDSNAKDKYDLDIEVYGYYAQHPAEFRAPPPAPTLVLGPPTQPVTRPVPTTKPFDEAVKLDLEKRLLSDPGLSTADAVVAFRARVAAREKTIRAELRDELASAYLDWSATHPTTSSTTQPAVPSTTQPATTSPAATSPAATSAAAAAFPDLEFLTAFADKFEAKYKVRPLVNSLANKWLTAEDLNSLPDIGSARQGETPFADYAMHDLAPAPSTQPSTQPSSATSPAAPTTLPTAAIAPTSPAAAVKTAVPTTTATTSPAHAAGGRRFSVEDFAKVDPEMAKLVKARDEAQLLLDTLTAQLGQLGPNNPAVKTAKASLDEQTAHMQSYCDQLNDRYSIRWNADGASGTLVPRDLPGHDGTQPADVPAAVSSWTPIGTGLRPFEPSQILDDTGGNAYIFRLTAFEPAHRPSLAEVEPQIIKQLKLSAAMQRARGEAAKQLKNAQIETKLRKEQKLPDLQGLPAAAKAAGRTLITTKLFQPGNLTLEQGVPGYDLTAFGDKMVFMKAVMDLCKQQTPGNPHPSSVIDLPDDRKVVVTEVGDAVLAVPQDKLFARELLVAPRAKDSLISGQFFGMASAATSMMEDWFDLENIIARLKYEKVSKG